MCVIQQLPCQKRTSILCTHFFIICNCWVIKISPGKGSWTIGGQIAKVICYKRTSRKRYLMKGLENSWCHHVMAFPSYRSYMGIKARTTVLCGFLFVCFNIKVRSQSLFQECTGICALRAQNTCQSHSWVSCFWNPAYLFFWLYFWLSYL